MFRPTLFALVSLCALHGPVQAVPPSAALLPGNTKLHVSIPDVHKLEKAWKSTKIAQLFADPKLKPFLDDLMKDSPWAKLGLDWADVTNVARGEVSFAAVPAAPGQAAHVITLYSNGQAMALMKMQAKITSSMQKQGYKVGTKNVGGVKVTTYTRAPKDKNDRNNNLFSFTKDKMLVAADNELAVEEILRRWSGNSPDRLDQRKPYQEVLARAKAQGKGAGDFFWFMEPIGLAEAERKASRIPRRGPDMLKTLKDEGFTAIEGIGGFVLLGQGEFDILHHTAIYAPGPYQKSMRMLKTLAGPDFTPPDWVPGDAARCDIVYLDVNNAFQNVGSLFDAVYGEGDAGTFDDILKGMRDDPNGPQVDVGKEVIGRLGQRVTLVSAIERPIGVNSVGTLAGVDVKDEQGLAQAIRKLMENDEDIKRHDAAGGVVLWEMITREKKKKKGRTPAAAKPKAPNSGVAVARGQLFIASDFRLLEKLLAGTTKALATDADYQRVAKDMATLGGGKDCLRSFVRPDADFEAVYELLRTHQLDQAPSLSARVLVNLFGAKVKTIDASKFPDFQEFRRYLGPAGLRCVTETGGWSMTGVMLRKQ